MDCTILARKLQKEQSRIYCPHLLPAFGGAYSLLIFSIFTRFCSEVVWRWFETGSNKSVQKQEYMKWRCFPKSWHQVVSCRAYHLLWHSTDWNSPDCKVSLTTCHCCSMVCFLPCISWVHHILGHPDSNIVLSPDNQSEHQTSLDTTVPDGSIWT